LAIRFPYCPLGQCMVAWSKERSFTADNLANCVM
jgi:hypothetical protein